MKTTAKLITDIPERQSEYSVSETLQKYQAQTSKQIEKKESSKTKLNSLIFILNVLSMLYFCSACPYYFFAPRSEGHTKGVIAGVSIGLAVVFIFPTLIYVAPLKKIFQLAFLIDTIMLATISGVIAFVNMILIFDKGGTWYYPLMQVSFSISVFVYSTATRVFLAHLEWPKWQLLVFKIHLMLNCLLFFISGIHFVYIDFTYTNHRLKSFDSKVHEFMVMFIFTMFGWVYEMYAKVTDLDHTSELRFVYKIKNMDETRPEKAREIIRKKRESQNTIRLMRQTEAMRQAVNQVKGSRFATVQVYRF